jgi:ABC-2 type transport system permease protein
LLSGLTVSPAGWALALVCFLFGYAMYAALMAAAGSVATTMRESSQLTLVVILPIILPLAFLSIIIQQPGGILAQILSYVPLTAPVTLPVRQVAGGVPPLQLVVSLAIMAFTVLLLQAAATRVFRAHTLLSGSKPSLGAVLRALR